MSDAVAACNRCGECRTQTPKLRMCPIFRFMPTEEASPRAKANLLRGVLTGTLDLSVLTNDEFKAIADLCVHCHCLPAGMSGGRGYSAADAREQGGLRCRERIFAGRMGHDAARRARFAGRSRSRRRPIGRWRNRQMRWLLEKTLGIAQGRKLPRVASRNFLRRAARRRLTRPARHGGQKVLYFVDVYANYFDPQLAEALVAVLEHNGISVYVHPDQKQAGMASIALRRARSCSEDGRAQRRASWPNRCGKGYHIVATEPAAALCLTHEYPQLVDDDDARLVAAHSSEAGGFLWKMHTLGQLQLDFKPLNVTVGYHTPCHLRALQIGSPGENLLGLIPGLRLHHVEAGCSGMAGTFGTAAQELPQQSAGGPEANLPAPPSRPPSRRDRMQHLQDADGTGHHQADDPPDQAAGPLLRLDARNLRGFSHHPARS